MKAERARQLSSAETSLSNLIGMLTVIQYNTKQYKNDTTADEEFEAEETEAYLAITNIMEKLKISHIEYLSFYISQL